MCEKPTPRLINRLYKGATTQMWEGKVKIKDIEGWAKNPRIELFRRKWKRDFGQDPTQDEVYEIMKEERDMDLVKLRDDLRKNDLREPLVLTYNAKLLDGNRRFFAIRLAMETRDKNSFVWKNFESVNVFVLTDEATDEDEQRILVEENFAPSLKKEWPDYVKAIKIGEERDAGSSNEEIAEKFSWAKSKVHETIRILAIIDDYKEFALSDPDPEDDSGGGLGLTESEVEEQVSGGYQFFNEAKKSFLVPLQKEIDFKIAFFRWFHEKKFTNFPQVRIAYKAWNNLEAKEILDSQTSDAGKDAKTVVDDNERSDKKRMAVSYQVSHFLKFLRGLNMEDLDKLTAESLTEIKDVLKESRRLSDMIGKISDGKKQ